MPNLSLMTLANGARQLVVQEALEIYVGAIRQVRNTDRRDDKKAKIRTTVYLGSYLSRLTPQTNMGASAEGAEITTFLAPPFKCREALRDHDQRIYR